MNKFDLEYMWQDYLRAGRVDESMMHPIQKIETKRAFMAGVVQTLLVCKNHIALLPDEQAEIALQAMEDQGVIFWEGEAAKERKEQNIKTDIN